jgi:protein-tyrosine phosphatase
VNGTLVAVHGGVATPLNSGLFLVVASCPAPPQAHPSRCPTDLFRLNRVDMQDAKPFIIRLFQAIQRRIRHQIILFFSRSKSNNALSSAKRLDRVLVLCYGNIYRSPLVEYLLKRQLSSKAVEIKSAGFHDKAGRTCAEEYQERLVNRGYDLANHRSAKVTQDDIDWADIIVIMDRKNWDLLSQMNRSAVDKVVWVGGFTSGLSVEVIDPYNMGIEVTERIITQLERCVVDIAHKITEKRLPHDNFHKKQ